MNALYIFIFTYSLFIFVSPSYAGETRHPQNESEIRTLNEKIKANPEFGYEIATSLIMENPAQAHTYLQKAVHNGYKAAMVDIAMIYMTKDHSVEGHRLAKHYLEAAVSNDITFGYIGLGHLYQEGFSVPVDYEKARTLFQLAISKGDKNGYWSLAYMEENKRPNPDLNHAIALYIEAAKNGITSSVWDMIRIFKTAAHKLNISKEEILFWAYVHKFHYPNIDIKVDPFLLSQLSDHKVAQIKIEAEAYMRNFSFCSGISLSCEFSRLSPYSQCIIPLTYT